MDDLYVIPKDAPTLHLPVSAKGIWKPLGKYKNHFIKK